ncbi:MAG: ABC transporter ATP-binding protein [Eubacterium sp.]|nr:ABC transporter ATP-binding protein [Eubacterium sp.]
MKELEIRHISKGFDGKMVLSDVNLTLHAGEIVALLGVSGGGKTTLFNIVAGLLTPDEGDVTLDGESLIDCPGRISYMLQKDLLLPHKTVIDNIALPLVIRGMKKKEAREVVAEHLKQFGLEGYEKKHPQELSGGMRQRAALLRTYLFSGEAALLDEPFSALDTITRSAMHIWYLSVMEELRLATIFITHDVDEAILLADRIAILSREKADPGSREESDENGGASRPATISDIITIENRPRKTQEYLLTGEFLEYKRQIIDRI